MLRPQSPQGVYIKGKKGIQYDPPRYPPALLFSYEGPILPESMGTFEQRFVISVVPSIRHSFSNTFL